MITKIVLLALLTVAVVWLMIRLIKDQKNCNLCHKKMWFFQYVTLQAKKKEKVAMGKMNWRMTAELEPIRHCKCEDRHFSRTYGD